MGRGRSVHPAWGQGPVQGLTLYSRHLSKRGGQHCAARFDAVSQFWALAPLPQKQNLRTYRMNMNLYDSAYQEKTLRSLIRLQSISSDGEPLLKISLAIKLFALPWNIKDGPSS